MYYYNYIYEEENIYFKTTYSNVYLTINGYRRKLIRAFSQVNSIVLFSDVAEKNHIR